MTTKLADVSLFFLLIIYTAHDEAVSKYFSIYKSVVSDRCLFDSLHLLSSPLLLKNAVMLWLW